MLMALFLLLVALMVSAVVIARASSAATTTLRSGMFRPRSSRRWRYRRRRNMCGTPSSAKRWTVRSPQTTGQAAHRYSSDSGGAFRDFGMSYAVLSCTGNQNLAGDMEDDLGRLRDGTGRTRTRNTPPTFSP